MMSFSLPLLSSLVAAGAAILVRAVWLLMGLRAGAWTGRCGEGGVCQHVSAYLHARLSLRKVNRLTVMSRKIS